MKAPNSPRERLGLIYYAEALALGALIIQLAASAGLA